MNYKTIVNELFSRNRRQALFFGMGEVFFYSWVLFPLYYFAKITNPVIILTIMFLFFSKGYNSKEEAEEHFISSFFKKNWIEFSLGLIFGLVMRLWLAPDSLSYPALKGYFIMIALSSFLSSCIYSIFNHFEDYEERVPFAPLLFIGCILNYTSFLATIMHMVTQWNVLLYR
jgi:hypothetical protein